MCVTQRRWRLKLQQDMSLMLSSRSRRTWKMASSAACSLCVLGVKHSMSRNEDVRAALFCLAVSDTVDWAGRGSLSLSASCPGSCGTSLGCGW